jgi:hypothetical protein
VPLPPWTSLDQAGITGGHVLYLRDIVEGEADEPVLLSLDEAISDAVDGLGRWAWTPRSRAATVFTLGMAWLVAALLTAALAPGRSSPLALGGLALGAGSMSAIVAAVAFRRDWPLPAQLPLALAMSVIPEFAVVGASIGRHAVPAAAAGGALAGAALR